MNSRDDSQRELRNQTGTSALEIQGLTHQYGSILALKSIDIHVPRHSIYGLLGLNGAGKTTTLECALGLLRFKRGSCRVLDVPSTQIYKTWGRLSVVFDTANLYGNLSVRQNLELAWIHAGRRGRTPREVLSMVGLEKVPHRAAKKLSLGMGRRLSIARGLIGSPQFVIMDEPLSGLDAEGVDNILDIITQCHREDGTTFMLSSHRLHELESLCDHIGLIHDGRVLAEGSLQAILAKERRRLRIKAAPLETVGSFLDGNSGVLSWSQNSRNEFDLNLAPSTTPGELNASLHRAGFVVEQLTPLGNTLKDYFRTATGGDERR